MAADKIRQTATASPPLRELSTDRPDATESPFTVDPGHVQIEADVVAHLRDRRDGIKTREWSAVPFNLRVGLTRNFEAGVFVSPWLRQDLEPRGGPRERHSGYGDIVLRGKFNFTGNDGGDFAAGLIADFSLPTGSKAFRGDGVDGTFILPIACDLSGGWEMGAMTGVAPWRKTDRGDRRVVFINTVTVGREITKVMRGFMELTSEAGDGPHVATFDAGLTFKLNADTQLDCGANFGLSRHAADLVVFAGVSRRF